MAQRRPLVTARTLAERGWLYMRASSPKLPLCSNLWTNLSTEDVDADEAVAAGAAVVVEVGVGDDDPADEVCERESRRTLRIC